MGEQGDVTLAPAPDLSPERWIERWKWGSAGMPADHDRGAPAGRRGGCWPTPDQVLLLRAGLFELEPARAAWAGWRAANTLEAADHVALRLLPLVYRNLLSAGLDEPDLSTLKGAYRASWLRNQLLFERSAAALKALERGGVETMVLKGVALSTVHYADGGARPMDDVDILVRLHDADRAYAILHGEGWRPESPTLGRRPRSGHSQHLWDGGGRMLDLHWYSLATSGADERFWSRSVEIEVLGVPTRALCATDQLLHLAVHGGMWGDVPVVRWMADAVAVRASAPSGLDWESLVAEATSRRLTLPLAASLEHLAEDVEFPVPGWVLERLRAARTGGLERRVYRASMRPAGHGRWLLVELDRFRRRARVDSSLGYGDFLKDHFGVAKGRELIGPLARKLGAIALFQARRLVRHDHPG